MNAILANKPRIVFCMNRKFKVGDSKEEYELGGKKNEKIDPYGSIDLDDLRSSSWMCFKKRHR